MNAPSNVCRCAPVAFRHGLVAVFSLLSTTGTPVFGQCVSVSESSTVQASDLAASDNFGSAVAISGNTAVVGALNDDNARGLNAGAAYVFTRASVGSPWTQQAKLIASDGAAADQFGASVAVLGNTVMVGTMAHNTGRGAVYVFTRSGTTWTQLTKLTASDATVNSYFGGSISLTSLALRTVAVIGAPAADTPVAADAGAAYVFTFNTVLVGAVWTEAEKIYSPDGVSDALFGVAVAASGGTAVIGEPGDSNIGGQSPGAAYVFTSNPTGSTWTQQAKLLATGGAPQEVLGRAVAISGQTVVLGAPNWGPPGIAVNRGRIYIFTRDIAGGNVWSQNAFFDGVIEGGRFGSAVSISGDVVAAGLPTNHGATNNLPGTVNMYTRPPGSGISGVWTLLTSFDSASPSATDQYGVATALSDSALFVGAATHDPAMTSDAGAAYALDLTALEGPMISQNPGAAGACPDGPAQFSVAAAAGAPLNYQWQVQTAPGVWQTLGNDPGPLPCNGGGAGGLAYAAPLDSPIVSIGIHPCSGSSGTVQHFQIRCIVSTDCGSVTSAEATYTICPADFNCSGSRTVQDVFDFLAAWFAGLPSADFNGSGPPPTVQDIFDFLGAWFGGC